ncbi:MAG: ERF family protein [bacterium]
MSDTQVSTERVFSAENLIAQAIGKGLPVDAMEKLLAMRQQIKAEQAREAFFEALARFQSNCPSIAKTKVVYGRDNRTIRYRYAPLDTIVEQIKGLLQEYGFSYTIKSRQDPQAVTAMCEAHHAGGHVEISEFSIPIDPTAYMNDAQKVASALTYAKRYAFCNAFGLMTADDDDDANSVDDHEPPAREQKQAQAPSHNGGRKRPADQMEVIKEITALVKELNLPEEQRVPLRERIEQAKSVDELVKVKEQVLATQKPAAGAEPSPAQQTQPSPAVEAKPATEAGKPPAKSQRERDMEKLDQIKKSATDAERVGGETKQQEMDIPEPIDQVW